MTRGELLRLIDECAVEYAPQCKASVLRNYHMNECKEDAIKNVKQEAIDAIIVDFVNYIGMRQGLDYAMYTKDLKEKR